MNYLKYTIVFIFIFINTSQVFAAEVFFDTAEYIYPQKEEILVDLFLQPEGGESINTLELTLVYPTEILNFIRAEDSNSIINFWINTPNEHKGVIELAGIIPGGFSGIIDPLSLNPLVNKKPGKIITLVFEAQTEGNALLSISRIEALLNDGSGTSAFVKTIPFVFSVDNSVSTHFSNRVDVVQPEPFEIFLEKSESLYDGNYFLVFSTKDRDSGVVRYEVREENGLWIVATSPYKLTQKPHGIIEVKAIDAFGNERIASLDTKIEEKRPSIFWLMFPVGLLVIIFFVLSKNKK